MKATINVPDLDEVIKSHILGDYFSEIHDADKLLTELVELSEKNPYADPSELVHGEIWCKYEDDPIEEIWNLIEGAGQSFLDYLSHLEEEAGKVK